MNTSPGPTYLNVLSTLVLIGLPIIAGCSGSDEVTNVTEDAVLTSNLDKYGMAMGTIATGAKARALHDALKENGGIADGAHGVRAGLTLLELGLAQQGDEDASESFGISCLAADGDSTFHSDTCAIYAVVEASGQAPDTLKLTGQLAKEIARALPETSDPERTGSSRRTAGPVTCKLVPGPAGTWCTVSSETTSFTTFKEIAAGGGMKASDAKKLIKAFFPSA